MAKTAVSLKAIERHFLMVFLQGASKSEKLSATDRSIAENIYQKLRQA